MDNNVSKIAANANFFVQNKAAKAEKEDKKAEQNLIGDAQKNVNAKTPDAILDAMQLSAMHNKATAFGKFVNPKDYLSPERIQDIEASMGVFEKENEKSLDIMNQEFKGVSSWQNLSEAQKLSIATNARSI